MPETAIVTISQKIEEPAEKERLLKIVKENLPQNYGCIVRTDAYGVEEEKIMDDLKKLISLWNEINLKFKQTCNKKETSKPEMDRIEEPKERLLYNNKESIALL